MGELLGSPFLRDDIPLLPYLILPQHCHKQSGEKPDAIITISQSASFPKPRSKSPVCILEIAESDYTV